VNNDIALLVLSSPACTELIGAMAHKLGVTLRQESISNINFM